MFNERRDSSSESDNVIYMSDYRDPVPRRYLFDDAVRLCSRVVHKSVRALIRKAYLWNKIADAR
jgi:hypothetical protein